MNNGTNEISEKATAHVVKMLDGTDGARWNGTNPMYEGICGWCGVMSPMNRPAFVAKYGEAFTALVEVRARNVLKIRADFWNNSNAKKHEEQATALMSADPSTYEVGMFVWGVTSGLKCDHGSFKHAIENMLWMEDEHPSETEKRLCRIDRIEEVEDLDALEDGWLGKWQPRENEGGSNSDDVTEEEVGKMGERFRELTAEQKRTFYTIGVLVRDRKGKYVFIDPEGFSYVRYLYLPLNWKEMYKDKYEAVKAEREAEEIRVAAAKAKAAAERKATYDAVCAKWEGLMEAVPEGLNTYDREYRKIGKRNVAAMAKAAFPWVRFSVSYDSGWGRGYTLKWKNGPTKKEVAEACDFGLFSTGRDTYNGYDDSTDYETAEFADFANKFGGVSNGVDLEREECDHDQNGDPNGKPTKPPKPTAKSGGTVEVRHNEKFNGLEIYFPAIPSENVRNLCKASGFRWSKRGFWYAKRCDRTEAAAEQIVAEWKKENERAAA